MTPTPPPPPQPQMQFNKRRQERVRFIAGRQRAVMICILLNVVLYLAMIAGRSTLPDIAYLSIVGAWLLAEIVSAVFVFLLATALYRPLAGVLLSILALVPCIGLITLLVINAKATAFLKDNGVKVGLLGAKL